MMMTWVFTLSVLFSTHADTIEHDTFLLDQTLQSLGYTGWRSTAIPLHSTDDFENGLNGTPNRTVRVERFEWPFSEFVVNSSLSLAAFTLDKYAFGGNGASVDRKIGVLDLSSSPQNPPTVVSLHRLSRLRGPRDLRFIGETILRVDLWPDTRATYQFFNVETRESFSLDSQLPFRDIEHEKALSDELYVVAHRGYKNSPASSEILVSVLTFNPITRSFEILTNLSQPWTFLNPLFYQTISEPGRSVFQLGRHETMAFVEVRMGQQWQNWIFHRKDRSIHYGPQEPTQIKPKWLVEVLGNEPVSEDDFKPRQAYPGMDNQHLRKVTAGHLGVAKNHPHYEHYLYRPGQPPQLLIERRLVQADYRDGGLVGVSQVGHSNSGRFAIHRLIYDPVALGRADSSLECGRLMY